MELLFVMLFGIGLGTAARYLIPHRDTHGVALVPAVGGIVAGIVWLGLTWLGWAWDGGLIWVITLLASTLVAAVVALLLGRSRTTSDAQRLVALGG
ncbi:hypothetical protein ACLRGF_06755 [Mycetocola zhadangensis]|uniref:hypothetical protein n=1 Tax=Mycetocola zhadangensis TaxID=1164595 RepID=UPI003A4DC0DA